MTDIPEFASSDWLGRWLDMHPRTIAHLARKGAFPAYRVAGSRKLVRYKVSEVLDAVKIISSS